MREAQERNVAWMRGVLERTGWSPFEWAQRAGIGRATVWRAMKPDYPGETSAGVLRKLAAAAGVSPPGIGETNPADLLRDPTAIGDVADAIIPDVARLSDALAVVLEAMGQPPAKAADLQIGSAVLRDVLLFQAAAGPSAASPVQLRVLARLAAKR